MNAPAARPTRPMDFRTRKMVMSGDLNGAGSLFGGRVLEWVDQEAAVYAYCQLNYPRQLVTKAMSAIEFTSPAHLGDFIEIGLRTVGLGVSSISLEALVRNKKTRAAILHIDRIVFVNLEEGRPQPHGVTWDSLARADSADAP
ncbi:MAG TPA: hotdog domain-containing protein [Steroidobacteraceae bacterium]|nr:hotdog domain-containing protein [Steroidobacteraceae bacterium]